MGALTGLKILDFSTLLPGPLATMFMADLGAEVVSVTGPGKPDLMNNYPPYVGDTGLSASAAWLGRNKKTIELNLRKAESIDIVKKMVKEYDIVVEQFRPGVMKRFGLDYETLKKENPALIYCSISGFGQDGPLVNRPAHDINYLALSGNMLMMDGKTPQHVSIPNFHLADIAGGGYMSTIAILAAVHYREQTGIGQYIDMSLMDGIVPFACIEGSGVLAARKYPEGWKNRTISGIMNGPHYDVYETADHKYMSIGALEPKFYVTLCNSLGFPEYADGKLLQDDPEAFRQAVTARFKEKTRAEWEEIFAEADACAEPVYDIEEMLDSKQIKARNLAPEVPLSTDPTQTVQQLATPIKLSESPVEYRHTGYPVGYHTQEVLSKFGISEEEITYVSTK